MNCNSMEESRQPTIRRVGMDAAEDATGVVLVIDVIRAFSVAAYGFANGVQRIMLVRQVEDAWVLRRRWPSALLVGEVGGRIIPGFDLDNSPSRMAAAGVHGRILVQRTGAGTQGAVRAAQAREIVVCALVNAAASAQYALTEAHTLGTTISILPTNDGGDPAAIEDDICADYLETLMTTPLLAPEVLSAGLRRLWTSGRLDGFRVDDPGFPLGDVHAVMAVDRFSFAMRRERKQLDGVPYVDIERRNARDRTTRE